MQFRYAFATDAEGLKVLDITAPEQPRLAGSLPIAEAGDLYVACTYAYVPAGRQGLAIVDVERPASPRRPALMLSKGMDRDRAVDESGNQIAVWGRLGSRPFNREEMEDYSCATAGCSRRRRAPWQAEGPSSPKPAPPPKAPRLFNPWRPSPSACCPAGSDGATRGRSGAVACAATPSDSVSVGRAW